MSALWRLNLLVALFFALVAMVCLAVLLRQASHDVQRELDAAAAVVAYLGEMAERDPATLRPELTDSLRHVRVRWLSPGQPATDSGDTLLTDWLGTWLYPAELAAPSELQLPGASACRSASIRATRSRKSGIRCCSCWLFSGGPAALPVGDPLGGAPRHARVGRAVRRIGAHRRRAARYPAAAPSLRRGARTRRALQSHGCRAGRHASG